MRGVFVTGTDTGVGKTVVSAALMIRYPESRYWKPIQTGPDDDTAEVQRLSRCTRENVHLRGERLPDPVSPHLAASLANTRINLRSLTEFAETERWVDPWIVEGAGGVLVPVNESELMIDLIELLGLAVVVVARTTLGTINHTLLTLEALRARRLQVVAVVMVGASNADNRAAIQHYGQPHLVHQMPWFDPLTPEALREWAASPLGDCLG